MPELLTQRDLRGCQTIAFCYLCGKQFSASEEFVRDHVPPKAIFVGKDLKDPLILPVHYDCNQRESVGDEVLGQIAAILHKKRLRPERSRLKFGEVGIPGTERKISFLYGVNLKPLIWRCVKAFHAALYREFLDVAGKLNLHTPFPEGRYTGDKVTFDNILPQQQVVADAVRKSRLAHKLDRIVCYGGKCIYECTWHQDDARTIWACMFAFKLYNWETLGDTYNFPKRGCVGFYSPVTGLPKLATKGTSLALPFLSNSLDPFDET
jgi:hypothetical protein